MASRKKTAKKSPVKASKSRAMSAAAPPRARKTAKKPAKQAEAPAAKKSTSLADRAFEEIKEKILKLYFLPGQYLNEGALCGLLDVGRTPVHQALQRLQHEGLVEIMPRKGVIVQPGSISEILKILESRATVEADLARNAAERATPEDAAELMALARVDDENGRNADLDAFIAADRGFHRKFADMAGNPVLSEFARSLHERSIRYWYLHLWQTRDDTATISQHSAIAQAIADKDGEAAAKAVRTHVDNLRTRLMRVQEASRLRGPLHHFKS
jgi:GntR family transcriptional regulator, rspAB operon transcriptional repressor